MVRTYGQQSLTAMDLHGHFSARASALVAFNFVQHDDEAQARRGAPSACKSGNHIKIEAPGPSTTHPMDGPRG